jgi:hypothetical protein
MKGLSRQKSSAKVMRETERMLDQDHIWDHTMLPSDPDMQTIASS